MPDRAWTCGFSLRFDRRPRAAVVERAGLGASFLLSVRISLTLQADWIVYDERVAHKLETSCVSFWAELGPIPASFTSWWCREVAFE
jgi:hypothetical protein